MRIQIELDELGVETMNRIKAAARQEDMSHKEFFNNAMALLHWGVNQMLKGRQIGSLDEETRTYAQMTMPLFERIQANTAPSKSLETGKPGVTVTASPEPPVRV